MFYQLEDAPQKRNTIEKKKKTVSLRGKESVCVLILAFGRFYKFQFHTTKYCKNTNTIKIVSCFTLT